MLKRTLELDKTMFRLLYATLFLTATMVFIQGVLIGMGRGDYFGLIMDVVLIFGQLAIRRRALETM